jgi:hypothetical protein
VTGEGRPFSLFLSNEESGSSLMGLDGSGASLLGCGVSADVSPGRVNDFLESVDIGVFFAGVSMDDPGVGEFVGRFWKKPRIDFWFLVDCEPEGGCFFCEDALGVDISLPSIPRAIVANVERRNWIEVG